MSWNDLSRLAIHSVPRSGSSWLGQIFNSAPEVAYRYQPLFSYAFKGYLDESSSLETIREFFTRIAASRDPFLTQSDMADQGHYPRFTKNERPSLVCYKEVRYHHVLENLLAMDDAVKAIGLVRHPCATINSWLRAPREFREDLGWNEHEEWRWAPKKNLGRKEEFHGFEKWKEAARLFRRMEREHPRRFRLVRYEDLLTAPEDTTRALFDFVGLEVGRQTLHFLAESTTRDTPHPYGVYRADPEAERWREELDPAISAEIVGDLLGTDLEKYLQTGSRIRGGARGLPQ